MSETSFIGVKWESKSNFEGNTYKQKIFERRFQEKLKSDSDSWIEKNVPQLKFPPLKK
jgi:hypothetical protein